MSDQLTHFDEQGRAHMVDIAEKKISQRRAVAQGIIQMQPETCVHIVKGDHKKGDVLGIARIAGIMAAKKTADLIPLCHPLALTHVSIDFSLSENAVCVTAITQTCGQTGVEMEALTAVQVALLTIYDMCKSVDRAMRITDVRLLEKSGGKSGYFCADS